MKFNKSQLVTAAVAGILSATALSALAEGAAPAAGGTAAGNTAAKGHCMAANACKGKSACANKGANECAGKNACKGKGWVEKTKSECEAMAKKNKAVKFEAANG